MRIALSACYAWPEVRRGGERYLHELGGALSAAAHRVRILASTPDGARRTTELGVPVHLVRQRAIGRRRFGPYAREAAFGLQALGRLGPAPLDVWHAMSTSDGAAAALAGQLRKGLRSVFTEHGFPAAASRRRRADRPLHEYLVRHVDAYVCVSEAAGEWLRRDYGREPVVVPPGVDLGAWVPAPRNPAPALLYTGALDESRKNLPLLLAAAARLRRQHPDLEVWLLGQGDPGPLLSTAEAAGADAVSRCGVADMPEMRDRYARAWVTVLPSHAEAFGLTVVESLASGTPVVALRDSGGPAEILTGHPAVGVLCDADPVELAAGCLAGFERANRPDTVQACRQLAAEYDWSRIRPRLEAVYRGER